MVKHSPLTTKQLAAAKLIGYGADYPTTAQEIGVTVKTIYNWLDRDDFCSKVSAYCDKHLMSLEPLAAKQLRDQFAAGGWLGADASKTLYSQKTRIHGGADTKIVVSFAQGVADPGTPDYSADEADDDVPDGTDDV